MTLEMNRLGGALGRLTQIQRHIGADIRPAASAAATAPAKQIAEAENVAEGRENIVHIAEFGRPAGAFQPRMAVAVVAGPFVGMAEHLEGFGGFFKKFDGFVVARIAVRVILHRQFPIGFGNLLLGGRTIDPKHFVIIAFT